MAQDYRESVIQLDHGAGEARIWPVSESLGARLLRLGWTKALNSQEQLGRGWLKAPIKAVSFRKVASLGGKRGNPEALARARAAKAGK